jgi:hypothetical protein
MAASPRRTRFRFTSDVTFKLRSVQDAIGAVMLKISGTPPLIANDNNPPLGDARVLRKSPSPAREMYVSHESTNGEERTAKVKGESRVHRRRLMHMAALDATRNGAT